jgi:hypothetical protein
MMKLAPLHGVPSRNKMTLTLCIICFAMAWEAL